jgi:hypothetical protein
MLGSGVGQCHELDEPRVCDDDVDPSAFLLDLSPETVDVVQFADVALEGPYAFADCLTCSLEFGLAATGDDDEGSCRSPA